MTGVNPIEAGQPAEGVKPKRWAVIQTGYIDETYTPVSFRDARGRAVAIIILLCRDEAEARRKLKRVRTLHSKVEWLPGTDFSLAVPIYGIAETDMPLPAKKPAAGVAATGTSSAGEPPTTGRGRKRGGK